MSKATTGKITKFARKCDFCGKGMNSGYVQADTEHACSDECLLFTEPEVDRYWTDWEDPDEYDYEELNGQVEEIGFWTDDPNFVEVT